MVQTQSTSDRAEAPVRAFDTSNAIDSLKTLCSRRFEGRRVGTAGHKKARAWLRDQLQSSGLVSEAFVVPGATLRDLYAAPTLSTVSSGGRVIRTFIHRSEFCEHPRSADQWVPRQGPFHRGTEVNPEGAWVLPDKVPKGDEFSRLAEDLRGRGALGIFVLREVSREGYLTKQIMASATAALPVLAVRPEVLPELETRQVRASVPLRTTTVNAINMIGRLRGRDRTLKSSPLIVGAHFDAVGDDPGGYRNPGAGDNAAGVAVVLEVARVLGKMPNKPLRPVLFVGFDGEEVGAAGSRGLADWLRQRGQRPLVMNLDGAARFHASVSVEASPGSESLLQALDHAARQLGIPLATGNVASDNRQFARVGFSSVGLALGSVGMHSPADKPEQVEHAAIRIAGQLLLATIWQIAF
jgi:aminopeptidase YwaD